MEDNGGGLGQGNSVLVLAWRWATVAARWRARWGSAWAPWPWPEEGDWREKKAGDRRKKNHSVKCLIKIQGPKTWV